jgi:hypothetical protein
MDGAGTSAATPQVAAAAALYCQTHARELASYPNPWMRVEAVRRALFDSAGQPNEKSDREKLGRGALRAREALEVRPAKAADLEKTGEDSVGFAFLRVLTGMGLTGGEPRARMLGLEAAQLAQRWSRQDEPNPFEAAVPDPDSDQVPPSQRRTFLELVGGHAAASAPLRRWANVVLDGLVRGAKAPRPRGRSAGDKAGASDVAARDRLRPGLAHAGRPAFTPPPPPFRRLRGYAIDPSLSTQLDLAPVGQVTFEVPWEKLEPGPVGEYLEVVDIDPASGCLYEPVDLNAPALLAQDGLPPSEGTPQFHQQMVYAVASLTIRNFERALGRRALWRPGPSLDPRNPEDDSHYVQRLRVHPHALREANAYYSPQKVGLLFGYFGASGDDPAGHMPAARVFSCLSHDIVAHETTHALLDGMHRQLLIASNPDVHAFHEAFADIVALFQHFTFPEILRHQIAQTRGGLRVHQSLLGELATQFGRSTGLRGALRDAIGTFKDGVWTPHVPKPNEFEEAQESHDRGAFLVAAVFDAFLAIYERRVADLFRLSTGGTGVLSPGAIHPDLVNRLAAEATKSAQHVLTMCIRALDYCPPTDITFGEYLRALITADYDLVPNDDLHYRIAFVEAFRRRGIYPRDLRTLSVESLLWRGPHNEDRPPSDKLGALFEQLRPFAGQFLHAVSREEVFSLQRLMRRDLHGRLERHFGGGTDGARDAEFLGINPRLKSGFEVHSARVALRPSPDGDVRSQLLIGLLQRTRNIPIDPQGRESREGMTFAGGSTIIADLRGLGVQYCVRKSMKSDSRRGRQRAFALSRHGSLRATYLGIGAGGRGEHLDEPFAMLHRGL